MRCEPRRGDHDAPREVTESRRAPYAAVSVDFWTMFILLDRVDFVNVCVYHSSGMRAV